MSSAAPHLQPGPVSPGMAFGIREQILLALHSPLCNLFSPLVCLIKSAFFFLNMKKNKQQKDILSGLFVRMYHSPNPSTLRVLCIRSTAQCEHVNTFFLYLFFFQNKVLSHIKCGGELVANIGNCLFFTEPKIAHGNAFLALCCKEI